MATPTDEFTSTINPIVSGRQEAAVGVAGGPADAGAWTDDCKVANLLIRL